MATDDEITAIRTHYDNARTIRDTAIRDALRTRTQADICRLTGYTRETIRRIANPDIAESVRTTARARRATSKETTP
jgi:hypothetical protein